MVVSLIWLARRVKSNGKRSDSLMIDVEEEKQIIAQENPPLRPERTPNGVSSPSTLAQSVNGGHLVDTGVIQIVLALTAVAFATREFVTASNDRLIYIVGGWGIIPIIAVEELSSAVFQATGLVSVLLFSVYLWEWVDANFSTRAATTKPLPLRVIALIAHGLFLVLIFVMTFSQVLVSNSPPP